jgi:uncharacterized protein
MAHVTRHEPGTPSWVDLGTPDLDASLAFYGELFGWQIEKGPEEAGGYTMCLLRGEPVAAIGPLMQEGQPPSWSTYVTVDDAEATVAKAREAGAMVFVEPMRVEIAGEHMGTMAVMADPAGAAFSIWEPGTHIGASIVNEPGALTWNELVTRDIDQAKTFYGAVFGWGAATADAPPTTYTEWKLGELSIAGMLQMNDEWPAEIPSHWSAYFAVEDADKAAAKAQELGATVAVEPRDIPGVGRFSLLQDPQAAMFTVIQMIPA